MDEATAAIVGLLRLTSGQPWRTANGQEDQADVKGGATCMDEVSMHAGGHGIFRDMTLCIRPGEHVAMIGLSEAGKSGLEAPFEAAQERPAWSSVSAQFTLARPTMSHIETCMIVMTFLPTRIWLCPLISMYLVAYLPLRILLSLKGLPMTNTCTHAASCLRPDRDAARPSDSSPGHNC